MEKKCDTTRRCGDIGRRRDGTREGKGVHDVSWTDMNLSELKNKKKIMRLIQLLQMDSEDLK
jgi:hypothetical protein